MGDLKNNLKSAVITLGGKGTRLEEVTRGIPKPLWKIYGISTLERTISILNSQGITKFFWLINYKSEIFEAEARIIREKYHVEIKLFKEYIECGEAIECIKSDQIC